MSIIRWVDTMGSYTYSNKAINAQKKKKICFNLSLPKWNWVNFMKTKQILAFKEIIL